MAQCEKMLYSQEKHGVNCEAILQGVLEQLRAWREAYRGRQVLWVLSADFDEDDVEDHASLYQELLAEGQQHVWYVRMSPPLTHPYNAEPPPVTAHYFDHWQVVESGRLWSSKEAETR